MKPHHHVSMVLLLLYCMFQLFSEAMAAESYVYVSLDSMQSIAIYRMDRSSGDLSFVKRVPAGGQPGSLTVDPTSRFLHAAIRSTKSVSSFRISAATGDLSLISTIDVQWNPVYLGMDRTGKYLFTAHFGDNRAAVYAIGQNGAALSGALQVMETPENPHSILSDRRNQHVYVPCRRGEAILSFRFDKATGIPSANVPDRISTPDSVGPRHITFHPVLDVAYVANEFGRSVTAYRIDTLSGTLAALQTLPMQPPRPSGDSVVPNASGADVHVTPNGRFLYASNRGADCIAAYGLDPTTGLMTSIAQYPTERTPRSFGIDPLGKFLYVGGQRSGRVAAYKIDAQNGHLAPLKTYDVGINPVWVLVVQADQPSDPVALENAYVKVHQNAAACTAAHTPGFGTRVLVALTEVRILNSRGLTTLQRGEVAVFLAHESYQPPTGEFFEVAFKKEHPPVKGPEEWIEPIKNTVVYEDEQFRVFEERLAPGDDRQLHSHAQRVVVRLNEVQLTDPRFHPSGTPGGGIQVPNTVRFAEPIVHVVRNLSKIPLFNIVIELKAQQ